ncbi:hypothetical protein GCM10007147_31150 [Nocardiopsis kunsanensis]|uniref:SHSP domain-containing protein n=1 Tax=Nocardiopsis kunsanensis TaxID=141693 RepID=A0A918XGP4_9ACTN|nr:Hsp20/alpha crystallin family protein [Nocardiopsis kunsanensis]GHD29859.1 hypothetical protein GCM10007147_31150 [Nocardiopsis kunsanensis]
MDTTRELRRSTFTSPLRSLWGLVREMNRIADSTTCHEMAQARSGPETWRPFADFLVSGNELLIRCELDGVSRDDIEVTYTGDSLLVTGECDHGAGGGPAHHRSERCRGSFRREIPLEPGITQEDVDAELSDGLLWITVQSTTTPSAEAVDIPVTTAAQVPAPRPSAETAPSGGVPQEA